MATTPKGKKAITFRLADKKIISTKIGADFFSENVSSLPSLTPLSIPLGLQSFFYVDLTGSLNDSQATIINTFLTATGAKIGIYIPVQLRNYIEYLDWAIAKFGSKIEFFQLDQEKMPISNDEYISRCKTIMAHTTIPCVWNTGLLFRNDSYTLAINAALKNQTGTTLGRSYQHMSDSFRITSNQANNLIGIRNYIDVFLPDMQQKFIDSFPNLKQQVILQENEYDNAELLSDVVCNLAIAEKYRFVLTNTEYYSHLFRQSITNIISRSAITPNYTSIKRIIPAFKNYKYSIPIDQTITDCRMQGFSDGANSYAILATNQSSIEHIINPTDIGIKKKSILGNITNDSGFADTITSPIQNNIFTAQNFTIKKNSVNMIVFKTV